MSAPMVDLSHPLNSAMGYTPAAKNSTFVIL
jgi:hypothetical protein